MNDFNCRSVEGKVNENKWQKTHLLVDLSNGLIFHSVHIQNIQKRLINVIITLKPCLHVGNSSGYNT